MARKSLHVVFNDNSNIIYTIPAKVNWLEYWMRHATDSSVKVAWYQEYPKNHEPVLLKGKKEDIRSRKKR